MKAAQWALDSTSVFKVVMLNLVQLFQLQVEYVPQLRLFEDVCLNVQARNSGAHILKCMTYCYRADNKRFGGCAAERAANTASSFCTSLEDLISAEAFLALSPAAKVGMIGMSYTINVDANHAVFLDIFGYHDITRSS